MKSFQFLVKNDLILYNAINKMKVNNFINQLNEILKQKNKDWADVIWIIYNDIKDNKMKKCSVGAFLDIINGIEKKEHYTLSSCSGFKLIGGNWFIQYETSLCKWILREILVIQETTDPRLTKENLFYKNIISNK
jgi:hypothetical protein